MRSIVYGAVILAAGVTFLVWRHLSVPGSGDTVFQPVSRRIEPAPMCPWREPEADIQAVYHEPAIYKTEILILSGQRLELQAKLGRSPSADENSLYVHRVLRDGQRLGTVVTRRVKGEDGAIELVLAVGNDQQVLGVRLQQLREPEPVATALENAAWLDGFKGKRASDPWQLGKDVPGVPSGAVASAQSIVDGVRSLLVLLSVAEGQQVARNHH